MKLSKAIIIKNNDGITEIVIKRNGDAKYDSEKFKSKFDKLIDNIVVDLISHECHYSDIKIR